MKEKLTLQNVVDILQEDEWVNKLSEVIMKQYNECLDDIIRNLDNTFTKNGISFSSTTIMLFSFSQS